MVALFEGYNIKKISCHDFLLHLISKFEQVVVEEVNQMVKFWVT